MSNKLKFLYDIPKSLKDNDYHHRKNIVDAGAKILKKLMTYDEVLCCAEMQSGKSDVMKRLVYVINNFNDKLKKNGIQIDRNNIYLIICTSSVNLKTQLKTKISEIKHRIYHLNDINTFIKNINENESLLRIMADSSLIIFDECHCDVEQKKLIDVFRSILEKISKENKTIHHKVGFSSTPYEQTIAKFPKVIMYPGNDYYGIKDMFKSWKKDGAIPIIFQAKLLYDPNECEELFTEILVCDYYYIFRLPGKKELEDIFILNIEREFKKRNSRIDTFIYDMSYQGDINDILNSKPTKPTIIYIKDKLRMGEHLNTKYVYLVHDDPNNTYAHTTAQSLLGRCCGYNKKSHKTIIYCDYAKAYQHYQWVIHDYNIKYIPEDAKYIKKNSFQTKDICIY